MAAPRDNMDPERLRGLYRVMLRIRAFEEAAEAAQKDGHVPGGIHQSIGQEAIAAGVCANLEQSDLLTSNHRGHGHTLAKGADPTAMMRELFGKAGGTCQGKGGSMHIADFDIGMLGANGIVAGGIPIVTGAGLAAQLEGQGRVAVCFFGDGASNAGPFHEAINIAAAWKLPVLYVCENNLWAVNTPASDSVSVGDVAARAAGYGIPGIVVDGNDVMAVHEVAVQAVERARAGDGPSLIECKTYRWRSHTERVEQRDVRPPEEIEAWMQKDPVARLVEHLKQQQGQLGDEEFGAMDAEILQEIEAAVEFSKASPFPAPEAALDDVFAD